MRSRCPAPVLFTLFLLACAPARAQRLPETTVPEHYDLAFDVDLAHARFRGDETIRVRLQQASRRIVLHAVDFEFQSVIVSAAGVTQRARLASHAPTETVTLTVERAIPAGPAEIQIRYTGVLNSKLRGFYLSEAGGRRYAVTQLESTDARRAFPSFDEPAFKATFSIRMTIDASDTAISNGRVVSDLAGPGAGRHTLTFSETPKMSSYLVALAVGDFSCLTGQTDEVPIRICATPGKRDLGRTALDAAQWILGYYNRYYSIKYPFQKLDVVAVPDFAAGAMENTAAIFYREADLLADSKSSSVSTLKRIWSVLAHEMAHQWFGDVVTMRWWDDLWLNEGFATWMEKRPLAEARPEWRMEVEAAADTQAAMNLDSLGATRAIHSRVETPDEIEGSFDSIAYEKGAAVLRMIEGFVGAEPFRAGVNTYLEQHAYSNATSADFWRAMTASTGKPIDRILPTFVNQPGVPIVQADLACNAGKPQLTLSTERFFIDPAMTRTAGTPSRWQIPICIRTPTSQLPACQVIDAPRVTVPLEGNGCTSWAFVNAGAQGYFRTAYSPAMLRALAPDIARGLSDAERLTLIADEWAVVRANRHSIAEYLSLTASFGFERASGVLEEIAERLAFVHEYLADDRSRPSVERFVQSLLGPLFRELGVNSADGDDDDRRALRAAVIEALGRAGNDHSVSTAARAALERALANGAELEPTAATALIGVAAQLGDAALWDQLLAAARAVSSPAEHYQYLYGLAAFTDPALIDRGLQLALTDEIRSQDTTAYLGRFLSNAAARGQAWTFIKRQWGALAPKITISLGDVRLVQSLGTFCDATSRDDVRAFFTTHKLPAADRALDQTIERINNCIAFRKQQTAALATWLTSR